MNQRIILDTGVLVAYFRKSDRFHQWAVIQWRQVDLSVFTQGYFILKERIKW
jgi:uncharacterized protein